MDWQTSEQALVVLLFPYLFLEFFMKDLSIISYVAMFGDQFFYYLFSHYYFTFGFNFLTFESIQFFYGRRILSDKTVICSLQLSLLSSV